MKRSSKNTYKHKHPGVTAWALACVLTLASSAQATLIVVPNSLAATEGNAFNCIPVTGCLNSFRYQQVFASSQFGALSSPAFITQIAFRNRANVAPPSPPFSESFSDVVIGLSTTSAAQDGLSPTFSANRGGDFTVVHSGALTLSSASSGSV